MATKTTVGNVTINDSGSSYYKQRLLVATPTLGLVRYEWVLARYNQIIPTNWSKTDMVQYLNGYIPIRYTVADAQNLAVKACIEGGFEWLLLVEDDTMPPPDGFLRFTEYMDKGDIPVVSGLLHPLHYYRPNRWSTEGEATTTSGDSEAGGQGVGRWRPYRPALDSRQPAEGYVRRFTRLRHISHW